MFTFKKNLTLAALLTVATVSLIASGCAKDNSSSQPNQTKANSLSSGAPQLVKVGSPGATAVPGTSGTTSGTTATNAPTYNYADVDHDLSQVEFYAGTLNDMGFTTDMDVATFVSNNSGSISKDELKTAFSNYISAGQTVLTKYSKPFYLSGYGNQLFSFTDSSMSDLNSKVTILQRDLVTLNSL